ncbi:hypothetical protein HZC09_04410 [Candidatus Micrarchaeota archaeon]|nr:hypothetical protein [Candidatus Micrarchaeota archaeon]
MKLYHQGGLFENYRSQATASSISRISELKPNWISVDGRGNVHLRRVPKKSIAKLLSLFPLRTMEQPIDTV